MSTYKALGDVMDNVNVWAKAMELYFYLMVGFRDQMGDQADMSNFVGMFTAEDKKDTTSSGVAYDKFGELVWAITSGAYGAGQLITTPVDGYSYSHGWMGGAAYLPGVVAVSKLSEHHDALFALAALYHMVKSPLRLHHVGFRYANREAFEAANAQYPNGMLRPAPDHLRYYVKVGESGEYYREHQYFPEAEGLADEKKEIVSSHLDFVCDDPVEFLIFVAEGFKTRPTLWMPEPKSPFGAIMFKDNKDVVRGFMARPEFWVIENG
jgi:hypothetical protein